MRTRSAQGAAVQRPNMADATEGTKKMWNSGELFAAVGIVRMRRAILLHHFDLVNSTLKGGHGTIEWVFSGTDTGGFGGTGKPFSVHGVTVMDVHGTKLTRETDYWDLATVLREIGLL